MTYETAIELRLNDRVYYINEHFGVVEAPIIAMRLADPIGIVKGSGIVYFDLDKGPKNVANRFLFKSKEAALHQYKKQLLDDQQRLNHHLEMTERELKRVKA